ncbi:serine/threonine protein kinase [Oxalobacteraceae bacterium GrIS 1.18]
MPLHPNNKLLVDTLCALDNLAGRYEKIQLVNYDSVSDQKRGCFSLVFKAFDALMQKTVALKFYDIGPANMNDKYRISAFAREHEILNSLITVDRCLQLMSDLSSFNLECVLPTGDVITIACSYFAVEWIDQEIDGFFLSHNIINPIDKLRLFNEIVLSVETLHKHDVFHRDLKADNLRSYTDALKRVVVAIDLGTAARFDSVQMLQNYGHHVGSPGYASPEALGGLTAHREIAPFTDIYALGCLLFELFNMDYFYRSVRAKNSTYDIIIGAIGTNVYQTVEGKKVHEWCVGLRKFSNGIQVVKIAEPGSTVPPGIINILDEILEAL